MNKKLYLELIFLVFLGMVTSLSLPPFNYILLNFLTFSLFFLFLVKKSNQQKNIKLFFLYGWLFGFGYFVSNLYWISISLTFDQNFKFLIPLTIILIPTFLALFYGLISFLFIILKPKNIISSFLIFSLIFGILEFLRGSILTGFPWNLIAFSFSNQLEILSIMSIIGTYGFNLFCISLFTCPAIFLLRDSRKNLGFCLFFLITIIFFYVQGFFKNEKFYNLDQKTHEYKIRVIGSTISLDRFYLSNETASVIVDLIGISSPIKKEKTIFIWPEGILPNISQENLIEHKSLFDEGFSENHFLLMGINNEITKNESKVYYNSLSIFNNELTVIDTYNKVNLVPFGEFLPLENILKNMGLNSLTNNYQAFTSGDERNIIEIKKNDYSLKILPLICYEIIYSGKLFDDNNFDFIINISEDGWFGQSIGIKQHFTHSIFRAIESGKYVLRSANNGTAAIINPLGVIEQEVKFGASGYIDFKESRKIQPTIFSIYGNKVFALLILLYIFLIFSFNRIKNE